MKLIGIQTQRAAEIEASTQTGSTVIVLDSTQPKKASTSFKKLNDGDTAEIETAYSLKLVVLVFACHCQNTIISVISKYNMELGSSCALVCSVSSA